MDVSSAVAPFDAKMADPLPAVSLPVEGDGPEEHAAQTQVEGDAGHDEEGTVQAVAG